MIARWVSIVLDGLIIGRAFEARTQEIGLADVERIETALARDRVHHALDGDHALGPPKPLNAVLDTVLVLRRRVRIETSGSQ